MREDKASVHKQNSIRGDEKNWQVYMLEGVLGIQIFPFQEILFKPES